MLNEFSKKSDIYNKSRPGYAKEIIDIIKNEVCKKDECKVADIGSGTGIMSRELLKCGCTVYAIEPNEDMRRTAEKAILQKNFISVDSAAEHTPLKDKSIDIVLAAQSFHWFDEKLFKKECKRILKSDGLIFLVWNMRVESDGLISENKKVCAKFCKKFKGFSGGIQNNTEKISNFFDGEYKRICASNNIKCTKDEFVGRNLSSSYSLTKDDADYYEYVCALEELFYKYEKDGYVVMPYETVCYIGRQ